ncbi:MAG: YfiR family protein [Planctomycetota bacterium]|nr:MAG: YfiR family protein [Planctomycetota bacterium]
MKIKVYIFVVLVLTVVMVSRAAESQTDSAEGQEYQIKAAFLCNFARFVDWPKKKVEDVTEPMIFGIIGKDPFGDAFASLKDKQVRGSSIVIKRFGGFDEFKESVGKSKTELGLKIEALRRCDLLFICTSEKKRVGEIISLVENYDVLTVGDMKGFLEAGGIINFLAEAEKVRFEINIVAAERAKLKIRSKLLRLARRVIEEESSGEAKS